VKLRRYAIYVSYNGMAFVVGWEDTLEAAKAKAAQQYEARARSQGRNLCVDVHVMEVVHSLIKPRKKQMARGPAT
jgi:hypothetical protein